MQPRHPELARIRSDVELFFPIFKNAFKIQDRVMLDLHRVDSDHAAMRDVKAVAAMTLRRLQALHYCTLDSQLVTKDVLIGLIAELNRSLHDLAMPGKADRATVTEMNQFRDRINLFGRSLVTEEDPGFDTMV